ncbi:MAG: TonB family protein [Pirellulales bacterium]
MHFVSPWILSLLLHAGALTAAAYWAVVDLIPSLRVAAGRTSVELTASIESAAPWERPKETVRIPRRLPTPILPDVEQPSPERQNVVAERRKLEVAQLVEEIVELNKPDVPARQESQVEEAIEPPPTVRPKRMAKAVPPPEPAVAPSVASAADTAMQGAVDELPSPLPSNPSVPHELGPGEPYVDRRVVLFIIVGPDGRPRSVEIAEPSGSATLDHAALRTVRDHWRFRPAYRAGIAVEYGVRKSFRFDVRD